MQKNVIILVGVLIIVIGGVGLMTIEKKEKTSAESIEDSISANKTLAVSVSKRTLNPGVITVTRGETITMQVTSDESGEFHISGYEIEKEMAPNTPIEFSFTADKAGRYNFELHPKADSNGHEEAGDDHGDTTEDIIIGAFVVNPR